MSNPWDNLKGAPPSSSATNNSPAPISQPMPQPISQATSATSQATGQNTVPSGAPSSAFSAPGRLAKSSASRGTAFILLAVGLGITVFDWYLFKSQQGYSVKMAVAGPCLTVMGLVGLPFPQALEKDSTDDAVGKIARVAGIGLGLAAGALNWYFLAH
jgi:protein-S-isoprenylcysteine O-methyltransferase Ste14